MSDRNLFLCYLLSLRVGFNRPARSLHSRHFTFHFMSASPSEAIRSASSLMLQYEGHSISPVYKLHRECSISSHFFFNHLQVLEFCRARTHYLNIEEVTSGISNCSFYQFRTEACRGPVHTLLWHHAHPAPKATLDRYYPGYVEVFLSQRSPTSQIEIRHCQPFVW